MPRRARRSAGDPTTSFSPRAVGNIELVERVAPSGPDLDEHEIVEAVFAVITSLPPMRSNSHAAARTTMWRCSSSALAGR